MGVIVCDNEKECVKTYSHEIRRVIERDCLEAEVLLSTTNPDEVVGYLEKREGLFFILLELLYDAGIKGVDVAKTIRKKDWESYIVFATRHTSLVHTIFQGLIRPSGFLNKPVGKNELLELFLDIYCDHLNHMQKDECFSMTIGSRVYKLPNKSICYFEASQKKIFINTDIQRIGFYDSLEAIAKKVDEEVFIRCHKGFIINITKVERVDFSEMLVYLKSGAAVPISRTYKDTVKQAVKNL